MNNIVVKRHINSVLDDLQDTVKNILDRDVSELIWIEKELIETSGELSELMILLTSTLTQYTNMEGKYTATYKAAIINIIRNSLSSQIIMYFKIINQNTVGDFREITDLLPDKFARMRHDISGVDLLNTFGVPYDRFSINRFAERVEKEALITAASLIETRIYLTNCTNVYRKLYSLLDVLKVFYKSDNLKDFLQTILTKSIATICSVYENDIYVDGFRCDESFLFGVEDEIIANGIDGVKDVIERRRASSNEDEVLCLELLTSYLIDEIVISILFSGISLCEVGEDINESFRSIKLLLLVIKSLVFC